MLALLCALSFMRAVEPSDRARKRAALQGLRVAPDHRLRATPSPRGAGLWLASFALYVAALLCKEAALPLPGLLLLWAFLWLDPGAQRRWHAALMTIPLWVAGFAYAGYQYVFLSTRESLPAGISELNLGTRLMFGAQTLATYFLKLLFPVRNEPLMASWSQPPANAGQTALLAVGFLVVGAIFILHIVRRRRWSFGFWWFLLALAPVSNLVSFNSARPVAEQRLYLPSVGFALMVGTIVVAKKDRVCGTGAPACDLSTSTAEGSP
jgi:hypothetical protein